MWFNSWIQIDQEFPSTDEVLSADCRTRRVQGDADCDILITGLIHYSGGGWRSSIASRGLTGARKPFMFTQQDVLELNRTSWTYANRRFNERKGDFAQAIQNGHGPPEPFLDILTPRPTDNILQLLCNDGREAAAISHQTGAYIHGVDFSDDAISFATRLNQHLSLTNRFTVSEVYSYLSSGTPEKYDKILLTLGSLRWLPDLPAFFNLCSRWLLASGIITVWDFHPLPQCLDEDRRLINNYPLSPTSYKRGEGVRDYVGEQFDFHMFSRRPKQSNVFHNPHPVYISEYSCAHVVTAAIATRCFALTSYIEYPFSWEEKCCSWLVATPNGCYRAPPDVPVLPLTFALQFSLLESQRPGNHV